MMPFDLEKWKRVFEYPDEWFANGLVDATFVSAQADTYASSTDHDIEHYKWAAYKHALRCLDLTDRGTFRAFVDCLEADPNRHLYKGAVRDILRNNLVPAEWFLDFPGSRLLTNPKLCAEIHARIEAERVAR